MTVDSYSNLVSNRLISFFERKKRKFIMTKTGFFCVCIRLTMSVLCQRHSAAVEGTTLSGFTAAIFIIDDAFHYTHTCTVDWKKEKEFIYWKKKIAAVASFTQSSLTNHLAYTDLNTFELNLTVLWAGKIVIQSRWLTLVTFFFSFFVFNIPNIFLLFISGFSLEVIILQKCRKNVACLCVSAR